MRKNMKLYWMLSVVVVTIAVMVVPRLGVAQDTRSIVPYPRDMTVETVDPETKMPRSSFCIGLNTLDVKLTNNSGYRRYAYLVNRDTNGIERTLYNGWLETGQHYLSTLIQAQLQVTGPAGTEALRVDVSDYGRVTTGVWMTFYVQDCGGYPPPGPPGGGYGYIWARIYPYAIAQGQKGTITLQTNVTPQANATYYFEILNSYGQLWKRIPLSKRPSEAYQVTLTVGKTTKPALLTYTVNLWFESGMGGERQKVATTNFSFRVVTPGTSPSPYEQPWYPGEQGNPYAPGYSWPPTSNPYGGMMPYPGTDNQGLPYTTVPYGTTPYGAGYNMQGQQDRQIE